MHALKRKGHSELGNLGNMSEAAMRITPSSTENDKPEDGSMSATSANAHKRPFSLRGGILSQHRGKGLCVFEIRKQPPPNSYDKNELTFLLGWWTV